MNESLRLALDQNFPTPLIEAVRPWLPMDLVLTSIYNINPAMSELSDVELFVALHQMGYGGLVTNNYKMLYVPEEIGAIVSTKATVVAVEGLGHDPIRAVGALLLELPGLRDRIKSGQANVFRLAYRQRQPENGWDYLASAAKKQDVPTQDLWELVRLTPAQLANRVL